MAPRWLENGSIGVFPCPLVQEQGVILGGDGRNAQVRAINVINDDYPRDTRNRLTPVNRCSPTMPVGMFILSWDPFEGGIVTHAVPTGLDTGFPEIQSIEISHQFNSGSNWIIFENLDFKLISYYIPEHEKALVLVLKSHENAKDFIDELKEIANSIIPDVDRLPREQFIERMEKSLELMQAIIQTPDLVLYNFMEKIEHLENRHLDMIERLTVIMKHCKDLKTRILLFLLLQDEPVSLEAIQDGIAPPRNDNNTIKVLVSRLVEEGLVSWDRAGGYMINPEIDTGTSKISLKVEKE